MTGGHWRPGGAVRAALISGLALNGIVFGVTAAALLEQGRELPEWFIALFIAGTVALEGTLSWYVAACWRHALKGPAALDRVSVATLLLVVAVFVCTSSLHSFYPFRPSLGERLEGFPLGVFPPGAMLRFNYALTAAAFVAAATLAAAYGAGFRRAAVVGMVVLAVVLLIPNDNCSNAFNIPWIRAIGASPLMFAPASVGLLVGVCGLCQVWRRTSLLIVLGICLVTLLVGLGHMTRMIW